MKESVSVSVKTIETVGKGACYYIKKIHSPIAFVINTVLDVFFFVLAIAYFFLWKEECYSEYIVMMITFLLMAIVAFPFVGIKLKSKENGLEYNVIRWAIVIFIFFTGAVMLNIV